MKLKFRRTLFTQILINGIAPVIGALAILSVISYLHSRQLIRKANEYKVQALGKSMGHLLEAQTIALEEMLENGKHLAGRWASEITDIYLQEYASPETANLQKVRKRLSVGADSIFVHILNTNGLVVNTTDQMQSAISFLTETTLTKENIARIIQSQDDFTEIAYYKEKNTMVLSHYRPTIDGKYLLRLDYIPAQGGRVIDNLQGFLEESLNLYDNVGDIHLIINKNHLVSADPDFILSAPQEELITNYIEHDAPAGLEKIEETENSKTYIIQAGTKQKGFFSSSLLLAKIYTKDSNQFVKDEASKEIVLFILTIAVVIFFVYTRLRAVSAPVRSIVRQANNITDDNFYDRIRYSGIDELRQLVAVFNGMLQRIEEKNEKTLSLEASRKKLEQQNMNLSNTNHSLREELTLSKTNNNYNINYVLKLKNNFLPDNDYVKQLFPDSFILMKAKETIGGDFYCVFEKADSRYVIAGDCTGHSIPGGVLSVLSMSLLQHIMSKIETPCPEMVLRTLNDELTTMLNPSNSNPNFFFDGLDLAMLQIDPTQEKALFAGAKRPLYIVRENETLVFQGTPYPIGKFEKKQKVFEQQEISLQDDDRLYLFSDGYIVQTGDINQKKFSSERFQQMLSSLAKKSMAEQHESLEQQLDDWIGLEAQIDDILVVGVRFQSDK